MANREVRGTCASYIFEGAGGMRDLLEQTILKEMEYREYPKEVTLATINAGEGLMGVLFGTRDQCIVIDIDGKSQVVISNTTVGTYLYVEIYLMVEEKNSLFSGLELMIDDLFKRQGRRALYAAAVAATESAFAELQLKQCNSGYKPNRYTDEN